MGREEANIGADHVEVRAGGVVAGEIGIVVPNVNVLADPAPAIQVFAEGRVLGTTGIVQGV